MPGLVSDVGVVPTSCVLSEFYLAEQLLVQGSLISDRLGVSLDLVTEIGEYGDPVGFCEVEDGPAAPSLLGVVLDGAQFVVVLHHYESHCVGNGVAEPGLLTGGVVIVGPVVYLWYCLLYTSPSPRDLSTSRMPSSA